MFERNFVSLQSQLYNRPQTNNCGTDLNDYDKTI